MKQNESSFEPTDGENTQTEELKFEFEETSTETESAEEFGEFEFDSFDEDGEDKPAVDPSLELDETAKDAQDNGTEEFDFDTSFDDESTEEVTTEEFSLDEGDNIDAPAFKEESFDLVEEDTFAEEDESFAEEPESILEPISESDLEGGDAVTYEESEDEGAPFETLDNGDSEDPFATFDESGSESPEDDPFAASEDEENAAVEPVDVAGSESASEIADALTDIDADIPYDDVKVEEKSEDKSSKGNPESTDSKLDAIKRILMIVALGGVGAGMGLMHLKNGELEQKLVELEDSRSSSASVEELMVVNLQMLKSELREEFMLADKEVSERADRRIKVFLDEKANLLSLDIGHQVDEQVDLKMKDVTEKFSQVAFKLKKEVDAAGELATSNGESIVEAHALMKSMTDESARLGDMIGSMATTMGVMEEKLAKTDSASKEQLMSVIEELEQSKLDLEERFAQLTSAFVELDTHVGTMMVSRGLRKELDDITEYKISFATSERALIVYKVNGAEEKKIIKVGDSFNGKTVTGFKDNVIFFEK
ncbi:hypothetical protein [Vibrio crassostreae]|uniref:hypothetical protein n=1 Tax=Vibrio crassostreae TaxID=246167 RepID=UPI001B314D26|nr:hypothetical protein [Vibrio crassostreae]